MITSAFASQIYVFSIYIPLEIIFKQYIETFFLSEWKMGNIVPSHKKGDKQTLKN